jgi:hypothetical protein
MRNNYFEAFPKALYSGKVIRDIKRRVKIPDTLTGDPYVYLPYTITGDERPELIAYHYYGSASYVWLVYLANDIIDPYTQWLMNDEVFENYLIKKYQEKSGTIGNDVIRWTMNTDIDDNIVHYVNKDDPNMKISPDTVKYSADYVASEWIPVRVYDYEVALNESKRVITLVNKVYLQRFQDELQRVING